MTLTEQELSETIGVPAKRLRAWVRRGWLRPEARAGEPVFRDIDVARARLVTQLRDELAIQPDAVEVVLRLLDQVHGLRSELKALGHALESQPEHVRVEVTRVYRMLIAEPGDDETGRG
jgi:chaperone modulatory protein CbpM